MPIIRKQLKESTVKRETLEAEKIRPGKFKNDISIKDIRELKQQIDENKKGLVFEYEFKTNYALEEPKDKSLGKIKVAGELFFVDDKKIVDDIFSEWKNDKKIKPEIMKKILNTAFKDAQIEALSQAEKVGLPSPVPLMRLKDQ